MIFFQQKLIFYSPISVKCSALFIVLFSTCSGCSVEKTGKKPVIAALLDLHTGEKCDVVKFHGVQQLAILQNTIGKMNSLLLQEKIEISKSDLIFC